MKKIIFSFLSVLFIISCTTNDELKDESNIDLSKLFSVFKKNFPSEFSKIAVDNIQYAEAIDLRVATQGVTYPIMSGNMVIGRYFGLEDQSRAIYFDFTHYTEYITVRDVNNPSYSIERETIYDPQTNSYIVGDIRGWCEVSCTLGAMAIAASDGPSPLMDILAISYGTTCILGCPQQ